MGDDWLIINFQKSAYSDRDEVRFTVNLGVGLAAHRAGARSWPDDKPPPAHKGHLRERLGPAGGDEDTWWPVDSATDLEGVAADVLQRLARDGIPWLENAHTTRADRHGNRYP